MLIEPLGEYLFGREANDPLGFLKPGYRSRVQAIVVRTFESLRRQVTSAEKNIDVFEKRALEAFDGKLFLLLFTPFSFIGVWGLLLALPFYPQCQSLLLNTRI